MVLEYLGVGIEHDSKRILGEIEIIREFDIVASKFLSLYFGTGGVSERNVGYVS
jgi:hypothetical protein